MSGRIIGNCKEDVVHSGRENCAVKPGPTTYLFLHPLNAGYSLDRDTFIEQLPGFLISDPNVDRITPVGPISGNTPTGGDLNTTSKGNYGGNETTGVNPFTVAYQIEDGTPCMYKELSKLNGRSMRAFMIDKAGYIFGTQRTVDGADAFAGFLINNIYVYEVEATGTDGYQLWINFDFSSNYELEKQARHGFMLGAQNIPSGLIGLRLVAGTNGTATVVTNCGDEDVTARYGEDWATTAFLNDSGARPTSANYDADTNKISLTPAGKYRVADAAALEALDITGYEGSNVYATITAA